MIEIKESTTKLNLGAVEYTLLSISLPDMVIAEISDASEEDFKGHFGDARYIDVEVRVGTKIETINLDAHLEDFSITFPDGSVWESGCGKPKTHKIKENK
jgi:hypothetical protein